MDNVYGKHQVDVSKNEVTLSTGRRACHGVIIRERARTKQYA